MEKNVTHDMFPSEEAVNVSKSFTLQDSVAMVQIKGWQEGDCAHLEFYFGNECDGSWEPFIAGCCPETFCYCTNTFFIQVPGKYRLVFMNEDDNHISDGSWFEDVQMQVTKFKSNLDYIKGSC